jgi:hypothetical protein
MQSGCCNSLFHTLTHTAVRNRSLLTASWSQDLVGGWVEEHDHKLELCTGLVLLVSQSLLFPAYLVAVGCIGQVCLLPDPHFCEATSVCHQRGELARSLCE